MKFDSSSGPIVDEMPADTQGIFTHPGNEPFAYVRVEGAELAWWYFDGPPFAGIDDFTLTILPVNPPQPPAGFQGWNTYVAVNTPLTPNGAPGTPEWTSSSPAQGLYPENLPDGSTQLSWWSQSGDFLAGATFAPGSAPVGGWKGAVDLLYPVQGPFGGQGGSSFCDLPTMVAKANAGIFPVGFTLYWDQDTVRGLVQSFSDGSQIVHGSQVGQSASISFPAGSPITGMEGSWGPYKSNPALGDRVLFLSITAGGQVLEGGPGGGNFFDIHLGWETNVVTLLGRAGADLDAIGAAIGEALS